MEVQCEGCDKPMSALSVDQRTGIALCAICRSVLASQRKRDNIPMWNRSDLKSGKNMKTHELDN